MEVRPLPQQRHPLMHAPLHPQQQQQFAPSHPQPQAASQSLNTPQQQPLPMQQPAPLQQPHYGLGSRPSLLPGSVNPGSLVPPLIGQKRDSSGISHAPSQFGDSADGGNFAKLFVGSVPRNTTEEEVRRMFSEFGNITEVALIRDKRTGLQQGCCFIKYATVEEAERAIHGLHNQRTLPGGTGPVQVRFAGGEHERLDSGHITAGAMEHKLFVGSLNKQATEKEIEEIFAPYGRVDDVYIMRDDQKQSKGCAFVKFASRDMAMAAINALNGVYRMPGCDQPITVRFADPKRPRSSDPRMGGPGFGGPSFSPRSGHVPFGPRGSAGPGGPLGAHNPSFNWRPLGGVGMASVSQQGLRPYGGSSTPRGGPTTTGTQMVNGSLTAPPQASTPVSGPVASLVMPLLSQQQGFNQPPLQRPTQGYGQQMALQQLPQAQQHLLQVPNQQHQHQQLHPQGQIQSLQQPSQTYPSTQSSDLRLQHQGAFGQLSAAQVSLQPYSQFTASQPQVQHPVPLAVQQSVPTVQAQQIALQVSQQQQFAQAAQHPPVLQSIHNQQQQQQQPLVVQPGSIQLQQQQQQLQQQQQHQQHQQQQLQQQQQQQQQPQQFSLSQPSSQQQQQPQIQPLQTSQQAYFQGSLPPVQQQVTLQPSWSLPLQSQVGSSVSVATTSPVSSTPPAPVATCDWTEHTSPEGHKYYYNSTTGESRWEKPEELTTFEQKQQQQQQQQQQRQSSLQQAAVQYASSGAPAHQTIQNLGYGQVQPASGLPQQISAGQQIAPTQQMFPGQQMVPGQQVTPLHQIVHGQQVVPAQVHAQQAQQIIPGHQMSHVQQVVPGQQMTPAQQILPGQQTLPAQQGVSSVQDWMWRMKPTGP